MWSSSIARQKRICSSASSLGRAHADDAVGPLPGDRATGGKHGVEDPVAERARRVGRAPRARARASTGPRGAGRRRPWAEHTSLGPDPKCLTPQCRRHLTVPWHRGARLCRAWRCAARGTRSPPGRPRCTSATRRPGASELAGLFGRLGADPRGGDVRRGRLRAGPDDRRARGAVRPGGRRSTSRRRCSSGRGRPSPRRTSGSSPSRASGSTAWTTRVADALVCYLVLQHLPSRAGRRRRTSASSRACSRRDGEAFVQVPVLGSAGRLVARACAARWSRLGRRPDTGAAFRGFRLTAASSTARSPTPACRSSPRTRGRPPTASAATGSCGSRAR